MILGPRNGTDGFMVPVMERKMPRRFLRGSQGKVPAPFVSGSSEVVVFRPDEACRKKSFLDRLLKASMEERERQEKLSAIYQTISAAYMDYMVPMELLTLYRFEKLDRPYYELDTTKLRSLGFNFKSLEEIFDDCVAYLKDQGHLQLL
ncbi:hypothetical protein AgCh_033860 [Apium graveolens]